MIPLNELRLGNWVYSESLEHEQIENIDKEVYEDYSPIPLTPEILEKAGFVPEIWPNQTSSLFYYPNFQCNEKYLFHGSNTLQILGKNLEGAFWIMDCQFVHQLQNLYFALTGTELEINL